MRMQRGFAMSELCCSHRLLEGQCVITWRTHKRAARFTGVFIKHYVYISGAIQVTNNNNIVKKISSLDA